MNICVEELIVSYQALPGEPLYREEGGVMCLMVPSSHGVKAIRAQAFVDIKPNKRTSEFTSYWNN